MELLVALAALPLAAALLVGLRWRALRRPLAPEAAARAIPLAPGELLRLRSWAHRVRRALVLVGVAYLGLVAASLVEGEPPPGAPRWRSGCSASLACWRPRSSSRRAARAAATTSASRAVSRSPPPAIAAAGRSS
jgi:hypothetical protein